MQQTRICISRGAGHEDGKSPHRATTLYAIRAMERLSEDDEGTCLGLMELATFAGVLLLLCFYVVYMSVHLISLSYA